MQVKVLGRKCDVYILIACVVLGVFVGVNLLCNCPSCGVGGAEGFAGLEGAGHGVEDDASASLTPPVDDEEEPAAASEAKEADGEKFTLEGMTVGKEGAKGGVAASAQKCGEGETWDDDTQKCM